MTEIQTLEDVTSGTYRIVTASGTVLYVNFDKREAVRMPGAEKVEPGFISVMFEGGDGRVMENFSFDYNVEVGQMMFAHYDPTFAMTGFYRSTPVVKIECVTEPTVEKADTATIL